MPVVDLCFAVGAAAAAPAARVCTAGGRGRAAQPRQPLRLLHLPPLLERHILLVAAQGQAIGHSAAGRRRACRRRRWRRRRSGKPHTAHSLVLSILDQQVVLLLVQLLSPVALHGLSRWLLLLLLRGGRRGAVLHVLRRIAIACGRHGRAPGAVASGRKARELLRPSASWVPLSDDRQGDAMASWLTGGTTQALPMPPPCRPSKLGARCCTWTVTIRLIRPCISAAARWHAMEVRKGFSCLQAAGASCSPLACPCPLQPIP